MNDPRDIRLSPDAHRPVSRICGQGPSRLRARPTAFRGLGRDRPVTTEQDGDLLPAGEVRIMSKTGLEVTGGVKRTSSGVKLKVRCATRRLPGGRRRRIPLAPAVNPCGGYTIRLCPNYVNSLLPMRGAVPDTVHWVGTRLAGRVEPPRGGACPPFSRSEARQRLFGAARRISTARKLPPMPALETGSRSEDPLTLR